MSFLQVYWGNGCQIIPPHDAGIAASITQNLELWELPAQLPTELVYDPTQQIAESYYSKLTANLLMRGAEANEAAARAVYTPLHGVGGKYVQRAFKVCGDCDCGIEAFGFRTLVDVCWLILSWRVQTHAGMLWKRCWRACALANQPQTSPVLPGSGLDKRGSGWNRPCVWCTVNPQ